MRRVTKAAVMGGIAVIGAATLTACEENASLATPTSMCGYLVGSGAFNNDRAQSREVTNIIGPGQVKEFKDQDWDARYFPCGPRNYIVGDGFGDSQTGLRVRTLDGTEALAYVSVYWQPNQSTEALPQFITFLEKYQAATGDVNAAGKNFATDGWNGMLGENMWWVLQRIAEPAFAKVGDDVWKTSDTELKNQAAIAMADAFADEMQKTNGYTQDLFCGSGATGFGDDFDCAKVRIVVDKVKAADQGLQESTQQKQAQEVQVKTEADLAAERVRLTDQLYGPALAPQIRACMDTQTKGGKCTVIVGGGEVQIQQP